MVALYILYSLLWATLPQMTRDQAVKAATDLLVQELGLSPDSIQVRRATAVEWPDESLGCPKEGEVYRMESTPGYRVSLQAEGRMFFVHLGPDRGVVCESPLRSREGENARETRRIEAAAEEAIALPDAPALRELVTWARKDLAGRLDVEPETIDLLEISDVQWPDGSLGCPEPGKAYPQVVLEGQLIRLRSGKRVYRYHRGQGGAPFLCESPAR